MVRMNRQISSEALFDFVIIKSKHVSEICCPIKLVICFDKLWIFILVSVNDCCDSWNFCDKIHCVLIVKLPILWFVDTGLIGLEKLAVLLQMKNCHWEHCHWVKILWKSKDEFQIFLSQNASLSPFLMNFIKLSISWESSCHQKPPHDFRQRLYSSFGFLRKFLELRNWVSFESDSFHWIQGTSIMKQDRKSSHSLHCVLNMDFGNFPITKLFP